jgi:outer membrane protein OmpA-like peptidoglycan-associated protein
LAFAAVAPPSAQAQTQPWVGIEAVSVNLGLGGASGDGQLHLPNLGSNCVYPFTVDGFGAGIQVGVSKVAATGVVQGMKEVTDLAGSYTATGGQATVIAGAGATSMKNKGNGVSIDLKSETQGLNIGFSAAGMNIGMNVPPESPSRAYVIEFGFNKTWVNQDSRAVLDQIVAAWKCRYSNIWVFGHTDTVGQEDANLGLSVARAAAARDYLIGAGIVSSRIRIEGKSENDLKVPTADNVRLRSNRAVTVIIQD